jgi:hypothetical protein
VFAPPDGFIAQRNKEKSFPDRSKIAVAQDSRQDSASKKPGKIIRFAGDQDYSAESFCKIFRKYPCALLALISQLSHP